MRSVYSAGSSIPKYISSVLIALPIYPACEFCMRLTPLHFAIAWLLLFSCRAAAEDWPGWRGPRGDGTSLESKVPVRWSKSENVHWKAAIPGKGHSSPIIWGERIFVTTCLEKEGKRLLLCLNRANGKLVWQKEVLLAPLERKHNLNSFASATPVTDGRYVWVAFLQTSTMQVACYDFDGS